MTSANKKYASGKNALGICDKCGATFKLKDLNYEIEMRRRTGFLVCYDCDDPDHPQNFVQDTDQADPESLRNPRPDTDQGRTLTGAVTYPPVNGWV